MNDIGKRRGRMIMSKELLDDMMNLQYDLWLDMMHNAKIIVKSMTENIEDLVYLPNVLIMDCVSPYFELVEDGADPVQYKFEISKQIVEEGIEFEYKGEKCQGYPIFRFTYVIKRWDNNAVVFEGK